MFERLYEVRFAVVKDFDSDTPWTSNLVGTESGWLELPTECQMGGEDLQFRWL